jgi:hypothetical protein
MNYVGIDYHKKYSVVAAVDEKGQVIRITRLDDPNEVMFKRIVRNFAAFHKLYFESFRDMFFQECEEVFCAGGIKNVRVEAEIKIDRSALHAMCDHGKSADKNDGDFTGESARNVSDYL